jgi:hypothetical protein
MKQVFLDKFNKTLSDFIGEVKAVTPDQVSDRVKDTVTGSSALVKFYREVEPVAMELSTKNEIVFSKEVTLVSGVNLNKFWNVKLSETTRVNTWKYLHTMYLYADNYHRDTNLGEVMKLYHEAGTKEHLKVDQKTKVLFGILDNLSNKTNSANQVATTDTDNEASIDELIADKPKSKSGESGLPSMKGLPLPGNMLTGKIGELASEIAKDINPNDFQMDNPEEMMRDLMSGKLNQNSPVFNLVNKISSKIQGKLSNGEVNEMELFQEAKGVMSEMGGDNSPFGMIGKMSKTLEKEMAGMGGMGGMPEMDGMPDMSTLFNSVMTPSNAKPDTTKQQVLKEKLRNKKRQMELRKKLDQVKSAGQ